MLKIKAPILTRIERPMLKLDDGFMQRMRGNYDLFEMSLTGEDFLHLLTSPPEIFLMENDGDVSVFSNTDIRESNIKKIEIINNFLNRLAFSDTVNLTYQDRVFITDVLHKMGITDISSFMNRVQNIYNEQNDFSRRLDAYWNHNEQMRSLVEEYISSVDNSKQEVSLSQNENIYNLHQDIFRRLNTGAIYQTLSNFYHEEEGAMSISRREMLISEQKDTAQKLLLQALINEVRSEELPLIYRFDNFYEEEAALPKEKTADEQRDITAAALLSVIRSIAISRREEKINLSNHWYEIANNLYQSEENTFARISNNLRRNITLIEEGMVNAEDIYNFNIDSRSRQEIMEDIDERSTQLLSHVTYEGDTDILDESEISIRPNIEEADITNIEGGTLIEETVNITQNEQTDISNESRIIQEQLTKNIEENNLQMRATYEAHLAALNNSYEAALPKKTRRQVEEAQRQALMHPELFMQEYIEEGRVSEQRRRELDKRRSQLVLTQSPDAFTMIQQFLEHPEIIPEGVEITKNDIGSLLYDSRQVENSYRQIERALHISEETVDAEVVESQLNKMQLTHTEQQQRTEETLREIENVTMVHKSAEAAIDEELLEEIQRNRVSITQVSETNTQQIHHETNETIVNDIVDKKLSEQNRHIEDLVNEGMLRNVNSISDKVYRQIERRLANERSRRGV